MELCLKQVGEIFNISEIIDGRQEKPQVINYYLMNKLTYKFGYNWGGFFIAESVTTAHLRKATSKKMHA